MADTLVRRSTGRGSAEETLRATRRPGVEATKLRTQAADAFVTNWDEVFEMNVRNSQPRATAGGTIR